MRTEPYQVTVVGGGITGLAAAYYLRKTADRTGLPLAIQVVEASAKFGGRIHTMERDGIVFEKGPDSFLARKLPMIDLIKDLGLEGELVGTNPNARKNYVLRRGKLHAMPPGLVLGIPSQIKPFMSTPLISPLGKLRAALDLALPRKKGDGDESLGDFLERRLGKEVLTRIAEPLLAGIYAGDTHHLSLAATFPQFAEMERKHRSLILGTMRTKSQSVPNLPGLPPAAGKSVFLTFRRGLQTVVKGLLTALEGQGVHLRPETPVQSVEKSAIDDGYEIVFADGERERSDAVIVALPNYHAGRLFEGLPAAEFLNRMEYVSVCNVVLAFKRADIDYPFDGSGYVIPRGEDTFITACTWTSVKWLHTAPEDKLVLRCYVGRSGDEGWRDMTEEQIVAGVRRDLNKIMGIDAEPLFAEVTKLHRSMPQYGVGHLEQVADFRSKMEQDMPGVLVTGAGFMGVGLPDCVRQGREAAEQTVDRLAKMELR